MTRFCAFALATLFAVSATACRKRPQANAPSSEASKAVTAPVVNSAATPQRNAEEILGAMNEALRNSLAEKGRLPSSIDELYVAHASSQLQPPPGKRFVLNPALMGVEYR